MKALVSLAMVFIFTGCAQPQDDSRLRDRSKVEADAQAEATDKRARELEAGLSIQQRFFQGVSGLYLGKIKSPNGTILSVRFLVTATIPVYTGTRVRNVDEITYDLNNLSLNIDQNTSWNGEAGVGCNYSLIKPRSDEGLIYAANECPVRFSLSLLDSGDPKVRSENLLKTERRLTAEKLLNKKKELLTAVQVEMRSIHNPKINTFIAHRVEE